MLILLIYPINRTTGQLGSANSEVRETKRKVRELEARVAALSSARDGSESSGQTQASSPSNVSLNMAQNLCEDLQKQLLQTEAKLDSVREEKDQLAEDLMRLKQQSEKYQIEVEEEFHSLLERTNKLHLQLTIAQKELVDLQVKHFYFFHFV